MAVKQKGFTLVESILAIIVLGISMSVLLMLVFPQVKDSARSQYEVKASLLAQSIMTEILSRGFDENSDANGGLHRCDEVLPGISRADCTAGVSLGVDTRASVTETASMFDDVDDYIGCWHTVTNLADCSLVNRGPMNNVFGTDINNEYPNFRAEINVEYVPSATFGLNNDQQRYKRITLTIIAGQYGEYTFIAYRGNY